MTVPAQRDLSELFALVVYCSPPTPADSRSKILTTSGIGKPSHGDGASHLLTAWTLSPLGRSTLFSLSQSASVGGGARFSLALSMRIWNRLSPSLTPRRSASFPDMVERDTAALAAS